MVVTYYSLNAGQRSEKPAYISASATWRDAGGAVVGVPHIVDGNKLNINTASARWRGASFQFIDARFQNSHANRATIYARKQSRTVPIALQITDADGSLVSVADILDGWPSVGAGGAVTPVFWDFPRISTGELRVYMGGDAQGDPARFFVAEIDVGRVS